MQDRHATGLHGRAGLTDRHRLRAEVVEKRDQGVLVVTRIRLAIGVVWIVGGIADLIATATSHDTQRAFLRHARSFASHRGLVLHPPPAQGMRCPRPPRPAWRRALPERETARAADGEGITAASARAVGRRGLQESVRCTVAYHLARYHRCGVSYREQTVLTRIRWKASFMATPSPPERLAQNRLLRALSAAERQPLLPALELVPLHLRERLIESDMPIPF